MSINGLGYFSLVAMGVVFILHFYNILFPPGCRDARGRRGLAMCHEILGMISKALARLLSKAQSYPRPLIIFILGAPGVGKGTASVYLKAAFPRLTHLSYGDLARYQDSIPGSWVSSFPRREGTSNPLLPAGDGVKLILDTIWGGVERGQMVWVIDGFPRTEEHVTEWAARMPPAACTLYLSCPPEISVSRILGRAGTSGRLDDADLEKVKSRVERAHADSKPMLSTLERSGMRIIRVDAARDVEIVKEEVLRHVLLAKQEWESDRLDLSL
ncbi:P-loop containing nucleoside triphosphate hydrolase protein [Hypoxylon rubiginosum]|uniref:P-loop containing nucleoside triphosphate hydrolase protein n=1 Tax=Hypoxylon rubiginosum TaxID=110542 RepID=A0ACC0CJM4_9PEZI|nr:P-loop containing nucleoside triphosphate hydrolase protein [Hypoxylon rubiginosum]